MWIHTNCIRAKLSVTNCQLIISPKIDSFRANFVYLDQLGYNLV